MTDNFYADLKVQANEDEEDGINNFEGISGVEERKSRHETADQKALREHIGSSQIPLDTDLNNEESSVQAEYSQSDLPASSKIDLWKKLQDLMRNQFREEQQVVREKDKKLHSQHKKYFKVLLPKLELDKFKPGKKMDNFKVNLVFSTKYFDKQTVGRQQK